MKKWRVRWFGIAGIACAAAIICGCVTVDAEQKNYPAQWPTLATARCQPPLGAFNNISSNAHYEYENSYQFPAPTLAHIFISNFSIVDVTHVNIEAAGNNQLLIKAFGISDGVEKFIGEQLLDLDQSYCKNSRWGLVSKTTHEGFKDYNQKEYDPLYTAAYWVGTFGLGAPISKWWDYRFTHSANGSLAVRRLKMESALLFSIYSRMAMNDDWFLFEPADVKKLIREQHNDLSLLASNHLETETAPRLDDCSADSGLAADEVFNTGVKFYRDHAYESALQCFIGAATHPQKPSREAMWQLCLMYEVGQGTASDMDAAKHWCALAGKD